MLIWGLAILVMASAFWTGLCVRRQAFDLLIPLHFQGDINRGWGWGYYTFENMHDHGRSFLDTYDDVGIQDRHGVMWIDYAPGRLAVMTAWAAWNHRTWPYARRTEDWNFQAFFVLFNTAMEFAAAAGAFMLTWRVVRVSAARDGWIDLGTGLLPALFAALLLWFNVAMIISSHGWPCGDGWVVAPFLWVTYFCHRRNWFIAGIVLAVGAMFKGQLFFVAAIFLLWPLFQLRWREPLRFLAGFFGTFGLLTAGWTLTRVDDAHMRHLVWPAIVCVIAVWVIAITLLVLRRHERGRFLRILQTRPTLVAAFGIAGAMAFSSMWLFHTNYAWFDASYCFGTDHWPRMTMGVTSNLPGILQAHYGWDDPAMPALTIGQTVLSLRALLFIIFATLLFATSAGIALQDARKSRRFLIAIVTPWLLFFSFPAQIHERYLLFAAGVSAVCCGYSVGFALLGVLLTIVTSLMTLQVMLIDGRKPDMDALLHTWFPRLFGQDNHFSYTMLRFIEGTHPDIGWALLLVTVIFFYMAVFPGKRRPVFIVASDEIAPPVDEEIQPTDFAQLPRSMVIEHDVLPSDNRPPFDQEPIPLE